MFCSFNCVWLLSISKHHAENGSRKKKNSGNLLTLHGKTFWLADSFWIVAGFRFLFFCCFYLNVTLLLCTFYWRMGAVGSMLVQAAFIHTCFRGVFSADVHEIWGSTWPFRVYGNATNLWGWQNSHSFATKQLHIVHVLHVLLQFMWEVVG